MNVPQAPLVGAGVVVVVVRVVVVVGDVSTNGKEIFTQGKVRVNVQQYKTLICSGRST